jgi:hypothetical protein
VRTKKDDAFSRRDFVPDRDLVRDGVPDTEDRSAEFHHAIKWLKDCGWQISDVIALLRQYPSGIARKYGLRFAAEAQRCFDKPDGAGANKTEIVQKKQNSAPGIPLTYYGEFGATADKVWIQLSHGMKRRVGSVRPARANQH